MNNDKLSFPDDRAAISYLMMMIAMQPDLPTDYTFNAVGAYCLRRKIGESIETALLGTFTAMIEGHRLVD